MTSAQLQDMPSSPRSTQNNRNYLILGLSVLALIGMQVNLNNHIRRLDLSEGAPPATAERKLDPALFKVLSFGNLPTAIDSLLILVLGDNAMSKIPPGTHTTSYYYLDLIAELDPMLSEINPLANMLAVIRGDSLGSRDLLERSQDFVKNHLSAYPEKFKNKYFPYPWQGLIFLGYVNIFELNDLPRAAHAFREAATMPGAPAYLKSLEKKLARPEGLYEVGTDLLKFMITGAKNKDYRSTLETKLLNLSIGQFLFHLNQAFQKFLVATPSSPTLKRLGNENLETLWTKFEKLNHLPAVDPWGGKLYLNHHKKVVSTTPHEKVFGID